MVSTQRSLLGATAEAWGELRSASSPSRARAFCSAPEDVSCALSARLAGCRGAGFCWGILLGCPGGSLWPGLVGRGLGEALSCLGSWEEVVAPGWGKHAVYWGSDQALSSGSMSGGLVLGSDSWMNPCLDCPKHQAGLWKALHQMSLALGLGWLTGQAKL